MINFNSCLASNLLGVTYECYIDQRFVYYKRLLFARIILFDMFLMCERLAVIYECFSYANTLHASVRLETGHCCIHSFLLAKNHLCWIIHDIILPNACVSGADVSNDTII